MKLNNKGIGEFALFAAMVTFSIVAGYPAWNAGLIGVKDGVPGKYAIQLQDVKMDGTSTPVKYASDINK